MPRKRAKSPDWLPKYTYANKGWYVYRPYIGMEKGKRKYLAAQAVAKEGCSPVEFFRAFDKLNKSKQVRSLEWLLGKYNKSDKYKSLSKSSRDNYLTYCSQLCSESITFKTGKSSTFGNLPLELITKVVIRQYLDGDTRPSNNRRIQYLKAAWNWAEQRFEGLPSNPCSNVQLNQEISRDRYIEDWEYAVTLRCAATMPVPMFAPAMEISYLSRARRAEVFGLTTNDALDDGLYINRSKGSRSEITVWSQRLKLAWVNCGLIYPGAPSPISGRTMLHDKAGLPYTKNALDSAWQRVVRKAMTEGAELPKELLKEAKALGAKIIGSRAFLVKKFTFHDVKTKGITDHEKHDGGHKSKKMEAVYNVKPNKVDATR